MCDKDNERHILNIHSTDICDTLMEILIDFLDSYWVLLQAG